MNIFAPPTVSEGPAGVGPLFSRYRLNRGISVYKENDQFYETRYPTEDEIASKQVFYRGGYQYVISDAAAAELIAAGYEVIVS